MTAASEFLSAYWPLAVGAAIAVLVLLLPVGRIFRGARRPPPPAAPPPPSPPQLTPVQRLAASIEQAAREKAAAAKLPTALAAVPPPARDSTWAARPLPERRPHAEAAAPEPQPAPAEPAAKPLPTPGHVAYGRPPGLKAPRPGGRDDLKLIRGIGPRIERGLNDLGVYHYDQIAAWDTRTVIWVENQFSLRGRIGRERWVQQARSLMPGPSLRSVRR